MIFTQTKIEGCFVIKPEPRVDKRGVFRRHFCVNEFTEHGLNPVVKQSNISENNSAHTLRGFHYQKAPHPEAKTISCFRGSVYDVIVDLRPKSKTYLKWQGFTLSESNKLSLHIPQDCAHAYLTLLPNTVVHYYVSEFYHPESEGGIRYNDPLFNFAWPHPPKSISEKDKSYPNFVPDKKSSDSK